MTKTDRNRVFNINLQLVNLSDEINKTEDPDRNKELEFKYSMILKKSVELADEIDSKDLWTSQQKKEPLI